MTCIIIFFTVLLLIEICLCICMFIYHTDNQKGDFSMFVRHFLIYSIFVEKVVLLKLLVTSDLHIMGLLKHCVKSAHNAFTPFYL